MGFMALYRREIMSSMIEIFHSLKRPFPLINGQYRYFNQWCQNHIIWLSCTVPSRNCPNNLENSINRTGIPWSNISILHKPTIKCVFPRPTPPWRTIPCSREPAAKASNHIVMRVTTLMWSLCKYLKFPMDFSPWRAGIPERLNIWIDRVFRQRHRPLRHTPSTNCATHHLHIACIPPYTYT